MAGSMGSNGLRTERWSESSWHRLMAAVADPGLVWHSMSHCTKCGRPHAARDCDPDPRLCWSLVTGRCARAPGR